MQCCVVFLCGAVWVIVPCVYNVYDDDDDTLGRFHGLLGTVLLAQEGMYILRGECVFLIYRLAYRASFVGSSRFLFVIRAGSCQWFLVFPSLWFVFKF